MNTITRLSIAVAVTLAITPVASGLIQQVRADIPPDVCGAVDPDNPCYYPVSGQTVCPKNNSYDNCLKKCDCEYSNRLKQCPKQPNGDPTISCKLTLDRDKEICHGHCATDWSRTPSVRPLGWADFGLFLYPTDPDGSKRQADGADANQ